MILLLFFVAGLIIGMFRGGGLSGLSGMKLHAFWLIFISILVERTIVYLPKFVPHVFPAFTAPLQMLRFLPLLIFALLNIKNWRVWLIGLGFACNFVVIAANNWQMPISWTGSPAAVQDIVDGLVPGYMVMKQPNSANLWFLADIIWGVASAGDILLGIGVLLTVQNGMARYSVGKHVRASLASPGVDEPVENTERTHNRRGKAPAFAMDATGQADRLDKISRNAPVIPIASELEKKQMTPTKSNPDSKQPKPVEKIPEVKPPVPRPSSPAMQQPASSEPQFLKTVPSCQFTQQNNDATARDAETKPNQVKLSPRLEAIALSIDKRAIVADVGCDHGKLTAWLALNGTPAVIAMDISSKSLAKTKQLVKELDLQPIVQTRISDGLKKLKRGEADVIVLAGMGGSTMCTILKEGYEVAIEASRLVLQPMNSVGQVRRWLTDNGFCIVDERLAEEDGRIYQILSSAPGPDKRPPVSLFDLEVGHILLDDRHPLLGKLLKYKMNTIDNILDEIAANSSIKADARRSELSNFRKRCAEVLEWLAM
jgi:tRNA (adenine22-N1)-methyltransferase